MYELTKNFRFETAHRLAKDYVGKCANIHGHSWNGNIKISVPSTDRFGMAVDFKDLGKFCKAVEEKFDHKIMLYRGDEELIKLCGDKGWAILVFNDNPTCEIVAEHLFHEAVDWFRAFPEIEVLEVTIHETCTTGCTFKLK